MGCICGKEVSRKQSNALLDRTKVRSDTLTNAVSAPFPVFFACRITYYSYSTNSLV